MTDETKGYFPRFDGYGWTVLLKADLEKPITTEAAALIVGAEHAEIAVKQIDAWIDDNGRLTPTGLRWRKSVKKSLSLPEP